MQIDARIDVIGRHPFRASELEAAC